MIILDETEKSELEKILSSHTFLKAMKFVAEQVDVDMSASLPAQDMAYKLAYEKGAKAVPDLMREALRLSPVQHPPKPKMLQR